jgi:hypothetical protein
VFSAVILTILQGLCGMCFGEWPFYRHWGLCLSDDCVSEVTHIGTFVVLPLPLPPLPFFHCLKDWALQTCFDVLSLKTDLPIYLWVFTHLSVPWDYIIRLSLVAHWGGESIPENWLVFQNCIKWEVQRMNT